MSHRMFFKHSPKMLWRFSGKKQAKNQNQQDLGNLYVFNDVKEIKQRHEIDAKGLTHI